MSLTKKEWFLYTTDIIVMILLVYYILVVIPGECAYLSQKCCECPNITLPYVDIIG